MKSIILQLQRYLTTIAVMLKDMFRFKPGLVIKVLVYSLVGTTLQAFALGSVFFILRHMDDSLYINVNKLLPVTWISFEIHSIILIACVLLILGIAFIFIYLSDKAVARVASSYGAYGALNSFDRIPLVIQRFDNQSINEKTGIPMALSSDFRTLSSQIGIGGKTLLMTLSAVLNVLYGSIFLIFLEPRLTLILLIICIPFLIPLNRFSRTVKRVARLRKQASTDINSKIEVLSNKMGSCPLSPSQTRHVLNESFERSGSFAGHYYWNKRWTAQAGARAVVPIALVVAGLVSMLYFWQFYMHKTNSLAVIVTYFGALRMSMMSLRQITAKFAAFARFYENIYGFIADKGKVEQLKNQPVKLFELKIGAPDLLLKNEDIIVLDGKGPFAVAGAFPVLPVNRYAITAVFHNLKKGKREKLVSQMIILNENSDLDFDLSWNTFLKIPRTQNIDLIIKKLRDCCFFLEYQKIVSSLDKPLKNYWKDNNCTQKELIEALLLRVYFLSIPAFVISETVLPCLGKDAFEHWKQILHDRMFLIYYQYNKQQIGVWGEKYLALVSSDGKNSLGIAPVQWINKNKNSVIDILKIGQKKIDEQDLFDESELDED